MSAPDPNPNLSAATTGRTPPPHQPPHRTVASGNHHIYTLPSYPIRRPSNHHNPQDPSFLYPFAPSSHHPGRGFTNRPVRPLQSTYSSPHDQPGAGPAVNHTVGYPPPRSLMGFHGQFGSGHLDPMMMQFVRARVGSSQFPPHLQHFAHNIGPGPPSAGSGQMRNIPAFLQPRVAPPQSSVSDVNGVKNARGRDESLVVVRDRKVRILEGASLYALCRSWLKNGAHDEIQPQFGDANKSLPRPLPPPVADIISPKKLQVEEEPDNEDEKDGKSIEEMSEKDLLKKHVKHAKRVRARLREERSRRIERYKTRLALLLPSATDRTD